MGNLVITLYKDPKKIDNKAYLITRDGSGAVKVVEMLYRQDNPKSRMRLVASYPEDIVVLRKKVVDEKYKGIENLVEKIETGEMDFGELIKKVKSKEKNIKL